MRTIRWAVMACFALGFLRVHAVPAEDAAGYTPAGLLAAIDSNQAYTTERFKARLTIVKQGRRLVKEFSGYGTMEGRKFFMAFSNPEDRGVKYLRLADELWIWLPDAQDSMKISGHMLRQGMMGSDLSYEDMLGTDSLLNDYSAALAGRTNVGGTDCVRLVLTARRSEITYYRRVCLVDPIRAQILGVDLYAPSGRLLRRMSFTDVRQIGGRTMATRFSVRDMTRTGSETVVEFLEMSFDEPLGASAFSKAVLSR